MKPILVTLFILAFVTANAQETPAGQKPSSADSTADNCKHWIETFQDKASGTTVTGALSNAVGTTMDGKEDVADVYVMRAPGGNAKDIAVTVSLLDGGCVPHLGDLTFFFHDESQVTVKHEGKPNCNGLAEFYLGPSFGLNAAALMALNNKKVKHLRIGFMNDKWTDMLFNDAEASKIMYAVRCLQK